MKKWTARQKLQMKRQIALISAVTLVVLLLLTGSLTAYRSIRAEQWRKQEEKERQALFVKVTKPEIRPALLTPNKNSRPQTKLKKVNGIVVHYTANPGTDAMANRNYFESRKDKPDQTKYKVSSHFIIGLDGTIVQCIPLDEISYASNDRNKDTVSIECCHPNKSGKFSAATQTALIQLCAWLCGNYGMDTSDIIRHYDVTGKMCPKYYVKHKDAWTTLKKNISIELSLYSKKETEK